MNAAPGYFSGPVQERELLQLQSKIGKVCRSVFQIKFVETVFVVSVLP